eukprot:6191710-Pleurochrysis_carterae.AAC.2
MYGISMYTFWLEQTARSEVTDLRVHRVLALCTGLPRIILHPCASAFTFGGVSGCVDVPLARAQTSRAAVHARVDARRSAPQLVCRNGRGGHAHLALHRAGQGALRAAGHQLHVRDARRDALDPQALRRAARARPLRLRRAEPRRRPLPHALHPARHARGARPPVRARRHVPVRAGQGPHGRARRGPLVRRDAPQDTDRLRAAVQGTRARSASKRATPY